jgi:L-ascorbate metabolism protein UlaG (beta-lactamase superfamily)
MKITSLGHAGIHIESDAASLLIDPILHDGPLAGGCLISAKGRSWNLEEMPPPTTILISHGHQDHFDPQSLSLFDRGTPILIPPDPLLAASLKKLGFSELVTIEPWQSREHGDLLITGTPSQADVEEVGVLVGSRDGRYWHLGDSEPTMADSARLVEIGARPTVVSAKFQPGRTTFSQLRNLGANFDKAELIEWLSTAISVRPKLIFPYGSGLCYRDRYQWMNRFDFPLRPEEVADLLERCAPRVDRAASLEPGDVVVLREGEADLRRQASRFLKHVPDRDERFDWEPIVPGALAGLPDQADRQTLRELLEVFLRGQIVPRFARRVCDRDPAFERYRRYGVVWQMVVHMGDGERQVYSLDFSSPSLPLRRGPHSRANFFVHLSGLALFDFLHGRSSALGFAFGDATYYEKVLFVRDGELCAPDETGWDLFEALAEPLTYYLRHGAEPVSAA